MQVCREVGTSLVHEGGRLERRLGGPLCMALPIVLAGDRLLIKDIVVTTPAEHRDLSES